MKRIAVLTSGGDAPGMNAAVRAVVRTAAGYGQEVVGVRRGFQGLHQGDMRLLGARDVANTIQRGGTILLTARSHTWRSPEGRAQGAAFLREWGVDGLVVIGGDGSFHGAHYLYQEHGINVIGVPGTIDNDLYGTDHTIGYFTAVETALDAVDKLRDTAASHERIFVVEVMGRHAGHIALDVAVAGGAEEVFLPEEEKHVSSVVEIVQQSVSKGKASSIIIVAEGYPGGALGVAAAIEEGTGFDTRVSILGHIQRGGTPVSSDRILASRLGEAAVHGLIEGRTDVMAGRMNGEIVFTPLSETWEKRKDLNRDLYRCAKNLSV
ncbi:6-phosphofructokinase [Deinococcus peraridilitoris]|uniref:ATP-dependent 6-phosphofructokinase n=1 Tax=Deinococcus peraridilitoris (strain DSM 19664 / LMG 22246 / CIP 109416 / KR-200) TaxID=937777 RepID=L0A2H1_DEIPD|nr:6-phosphofructokinase [Deinococcus peraridilitoris]AFZ67392.1 6-phosphofructokinase [Deinococcus peraridilitoris DSM 19664]